MKIGDLITFKIDYDSDCVTDVGIVTRIERGDHWSHRSEVATIAWEWGAERHRTFELHVLSENGEQK